MSSPGARYRELLAQDEILVQPSLAEPHAARVAEEVGFRALSLGGYAMGASRAVPEPLLSLEDVAAMVRQVRAVCSLPLMVDAGAGWGEPLHVAHATRTLELAGAAALHVEDQQFPKRAHYHRGVEHTVPLPDLLAKVEAALGARSDPDFVVCARTDAMRTEGYDEGVRRARACAEAGADLVMLFPNDDRETQAAPRDLPGVDLVYVNSTGNDQGRGVHPAARLQTWGWKVVYDSISVTNVVHAAVHRFLSDLARTGEPHFGDLDVVATRHAVEASIGLPEAYAFEARTVEPTPGAPATVTREGDLPV